MKNGIRKSNLSLLAIVAIAMFAIRCEFDQQISPSPFQGDGNVENTLKEDVARQLARAVDDEHVRSFLKNEAIKRFDGDFDILFDEAAKRTITSQDGEQTTFGQILFGADMARKVAMLAQDVPLLQISIPALAGDVNVDSWDIHTTRPLIAYIPSGHDWDVLHAFDSRGKRYELSRTEAPDHLVIVIGENERLINIPKSVARNPSARTQYVCPTMSSYYSNELNDYYLKADYYELCQDPSYPAPPPPPPPSSVTSCDRDRKTAKDNLYKMIFNTRSQFKKVSEWFDGGLDIEINIFFSQPNGALTKVTKFIHGADHDFNDCGLFDCDPEWFPINLEIVDWDRSAYGSAMLYNWIEKDPGTTTTYKTSFASTYKSDDGTSSTLTNEVSLSVTDKDDMLGESIVEYCDNTDGAGYLYNTGWIQFYVRQLY